MSPELAEAIRRAPVADEWETVTYLGFTIELNERDVAIYSPSGEFLYAGRMTLSGARRFIRGYRRGD